MQFLKLTNARTNVKVRVNVVHINFYSVSERIDSDYGNSTLCMTNDSNLYVLESCSEIDQALIELYNTIKDVPHGTT